MEVLEGFFEWVGGYLMEWFVVGIVVEVGGTVSACWVGRECRETVDDAHDIDRSLNNGSLSSSFSLFSIPSMAIWKP